MEAYTRIYLARIRHSRSMAILQRRQALPRCCCNRISIIWSCFPRFRMLGQRVRLRGLRARGGFEVSIRWDKGCLAEAEIQSLRGESCSVLTDASWIIESSEGAVMNRESSGNGVVQFGTAAGLTYRIINNG